jgi:lantibiotic modifying enzyme
MTTLSESALQIGSNLCDTAVWDESHRLCNWMGRGLSPDLAASSVYRSSAALGCSLYSGSTGLAFALACLYRQTQDQRVKLTALGALRRSIEHAVLFPHDSSILSFWAGRVGIVYVCELFLRCIPDQEIQLLSSALLNGASDQLDQPHLLDVIGGSAGAITPLLVLSKLSGDLSFTDLAIKCGRDICGRASWQGEKCFWNPKDATGVEYSRPLAGLSHGSSGFAANLLELYAATEDPEFLRTARGAFLYEDSLYSPEHRNWLDVRYAPANSSAEPFGQCATAWCHGAPGIALARLKARQLDPSRAAYYEQIARVALQTTISATDRCMTIEAFDTTLCHGLTGLSECLLIACTRLDAHDWQRCKSEKITQWIVDQYAKSGNWPCGVPGGGMDPSLMLGTAGIMYHLLRVNDPVLVPSLLFPEVAA